MSDDGDDRDLHPRTVGDAAWNEHRQRGADIEELFPDLPPLPKPTGKSGLDPVVSINPAILTNPAPLRQWLVPDWLPIARVTGLFASGGEGKTLLAQMLATACAIGVPWLGLPVQRCSSLLLFCEDDRDEMHRRQEDINRHYGCSMADLGDVVWLPRLGHDNALMVFDGLRWRTTDLFLQVVEVAQAKKPKLIGIDTIADVFAGNENDRSQARAFTQQVLGSLARTQGAALLALGHPSRAGMHAGNGESGSTAWTATMRSRLTLSTPAPSDGDPADPDARTLTRFKSNFARRDDKIGLHWKDGVLIAENPPTGIFGTIERHTCDRVFLDILRRTISENMPVAVNPRAGNYAPRTFVRRPERERFTTADFERAMHRLLAARQIVNVPYGRPSDPRFQILPADEVAP